MRPNSVEYLIQEGLGYCCEARFFQLFAAKPSSMIALRLGVSTRIIEIHRKRNLLNCPKCRHLSPPGTKL